MRIKFFIPRIGQEPKGKPEKCPYCGCQKLYIYQHVEKKVIDHILSTVRATCYKCQACNRTFRFYPDHQGGCG